MGLFGWPGRLLSRRGILATVGGMVVGATFGRRRKQWQKMKAGDVDAMLEHITAYDISRGAGTLLAGWMLYNNPELEVEHAEARLRKLLVAMDAQDERPEDQARSRFLVSKALFYLEGFRLSRCRYELYQQEARALLGRNPQWRQLSRKDVFYGIPFAPEDLIGETHRMLMALGNSRLAEYTVEVINQVELRSDADYMARLIAVTLGVSEESKLDEAIYAWFEEYRNFKIEETKRQESMVNTSISALTGGLPSQVGMDLLGRAWRIVLRQK